jgi:hypothetical protein
MLLFLAVFLSRLTTLNPELWERILVTFVRVLGVWLQWVPCKWLLLSTAQAGEGVAFPWVTMMVWLRKQQSYTECH